MYRMTIYLKNPVTTVTSRDDFGETTTQTPLTIDKVTGHKVSDGYLFVQSHDGDYVIDLRNILYRRLEQ